jgi:hypothetical protein
MPIHFFVVHVQSVKSDKTTDKKKKSPTLKTGPPSAIHTLQQLCDASRLHSYNVFAVSDLRRPTTKEEVRNPCKQDGLHTINRRFKLSVMDVCVKCSVSNQSFKQVV